LNTALDTDTLSQNNSYRTFENSVNRIQTTLDALKASKRKALVSYVVAGDPGIEISVPLMHQLVASGTDIIELGVPFSDPSAEGPTIQRAHERALANNIGMSDLFSIVEKFREMDKTTPVVLMGYANPIEWMGYEIFAQSAKKAGVDAVLTVDIPPEEAAPLNQVLENYGLYNVFLIAPTTTDDRIKDIVGMASGFLYYVSLKGVTGSATLDVERVSEKVAQISSVTDLPICVGFGIKDANTAREVSRTASGVVVGSAIVDAVANAESDEQAFNAVDQLLSGMREAIDAT